MSATALGYRLTCDGCGTVLDRDSAPSGEFAQVNAARRYSITVGWMCVSGRRADGTYVTLDPYAGRYRTTGSVIYDVCGDCSSTWEPPYLPSALAELADASTARTATEVSVALARLVSENERLRGLLVAARATEQSA